LYLTVFGLPSEPYNKPYNTPVAGYELDEDSEPPTPLSKEQQNASREEILKAYGLTPTPEEKREATYESLRHYNLGNPAVRKVVVAIICTIIFIAVVWWGAHQRPNGIEMP
jgi:hypothetical protein